MCFRGSWDDHDLETSRCTIFYDNAWARVMPRPIAKTDWYWPWPNDHVTPQCLSGVVYPVTLQSLVILSDGAPCQNLWWTERNPRSKATLIKPTKSKESLLLQQQAVQAAATMPPPPASGDEQRRSVHSIIYINIKMSTLFRFPVLTSWQLLLFFHIITENITITTYAFHVQRRHFCILCDILQSNIHL